MADKTVFQGPNAALLAQDPALVAVLSAFALEAKITQGNAVLPGKAVVEAVYAALAAKGLVLMPVDATDKMCDFMRWNEYGESACSSEAVDNWTIRDVYNDAIASGVKEAAAR